VLLEDGPLPVALGGRPWTVRQAGIQATGEERQVAERVDQALALDLGGVATQGPVDLPLAGKDVLDGERSASYALSPQPHRLALPPTEMILDRLEHHPDATTTQAPVCGKYG